MMNRKTVLLQYQTGIECCGVASQHALGVGEGRGGLSDVGWWGYIKTQTYLCTAFPGPWCVRNKCI